jgi:hypothetical protein
MSRLWRVPSTIAEYTLGTMIVLYQLSVSRAIDRARSARLLDGTDAAADAHQHDDRGSDRIHRDRARNN